jgi:hypothetical protein
MTLQMRKSPCMSSGKWVLLTISLAVTGRTSFFSKFVHFEAFAIGADLESATAGAVGGVLVAPAVKGDAVWIGRVVGVHGNGEAAGIEAIHGAGTGLQRGTPGVLVVVHHEDAALPVDAAIGPHDQVVGTVVGVGEIDALEHDLAHIGHVVAVGVFEEDDVGRAGDDDAAVPEFKAQRVLHAGELRDAVAFAVLLSS